MENLKDKVAIVTGGASVIGGALTRVLAQRGASVVAVDVEKKTGEKIVNENPGKIAFLKGDVSKESVAKESVAIAISKFGKLTGLVNNAHPFVEKMIMEHTDYDWALSIDEGFYATLYFMKAAYQELRKTKGAIVNFESGAAIRVNIG